MGWIYLILEGYCTWGYSHKKTMKVSSCEGGKCKCEWKTVKNSSYIKGNRPAWCCSRNKVKDEHNWTPKMECLSDKCPFFAFSDVSDAERLYKAIEDEHKKICKEETDGKRENPHRVSPLRRVR